MPRVKRKPQKTQLNTLSSQVGNMVRELRLSKGMTQDELGKAAGITLGHVSLIENGRVNFTMDTLEGIAKAFDLAPMEFLGGILMDGKKSKVEEITSMLPLLGAEKLELIHGLVSQLIPQGKK